MKVWPLPASVLLKVPTPVPTGRNSGTDAFDSISVKAAGGATVSVKVCVATVPTPLVALKCSV